MESSKSKRFDALIAGVEACIGLRTDADQKLVVGLSGGVDSVVLLKCLRDLLRSRKRQLVALHVNHRLSPNADRWEAHCRHLCAEWSIPLTVAEVVVERNSDDGLEAAARRARHAVFAQTEGDWILLAHHRDDQAETLLFNLLRGTGLRGAAAMREINGRLLRPMLGIGREQIVAYAKSNGLTWLEDESNADTGFSRNFLRHEILADLERRFPGATANLAAATQRFAEAQTLLDELALNDLGPHEPNFPLSVAVLAALDEPRARNVMRYILQRLNIGIPAEERLREALRQLIHAAPDRHPLVVFGRHTLRRRAGKVVIEPIQDQSGFVT